MYSLMIFQQACRRIGVHGHNIVLEPNAVPPYHQNRRMAPQEVELCETAIEDLLDEGFIARQHQFSPPTPIQPGNTSSARKPGKKNPGPHMPLSIAREHKFRPKNQLPLSKSRQK